MPYSKLIFEQRGDVAVIRLNEPKTLNAITPTMLEELDSAIDAAASVSRAILLTAEGRAFSSGANLADGTLSEEDAAPEDAGALLETHVNPLITKLKALPIPWISAVPGPAVGVGSSIALAADLIIAGESAYFLQAFSRIGLVPDGGATWLLTRAAGRVRAMELMLLGDRLPARTALEWGLISRVVPDADLEASAMATAEALAAGPTKAFGLIRSLSWSAADAGLEEMLAAERGAQRAAGQCSDAREGISAFVEKRPPQFSGC